jgi:protein O-mannosyl-transferase
VEVVAWVSCQGYLPCAFFTMLAVLAYLRRENASAAGRVGWLAAAWLLYVLALLFKAPALTLPAVLLLLDVFPLRRFCRARQLRWASILAAVLEKLPFAAAGLLFFALTVGGKYVANPLMFSEDSLGLGQRLARSAYSTGFYIEKLVWPSGLAAEYEWFEQTLFADRWFAAAAFGAFALTLFAVAAASRWPAPAAAWFAYLLLLAPVSGFVRSGLTVVADRYSYVASIPLFVALSYAVALFWAEIRPRGIVAITIVLALGAATLGLTSLSWRLCLTWRNADTLIARTAGTVSRPTYLIKIGKRHERAFELVEAESCFRLALELAPLRADVLDDLGGYLQRRGKLAEALALFERSIQIDPTFALGYNHLGLTLALQGQLTEAEQRFETALSLHPYYADARMNLASLLRHQGRFDTAAEHYSLVLLRDPDNSRARAGLNAIATESARAQVP